MTNEYEERNRAFKAARIAEALVEAMGNPQDALLAAEAIVDFDAYDRFRAVLAEVVGVNQPSVQTMKVVVEILKAKTESRGAAKFAADLAKLKKGTN